MRLPKIVAKILTPSPLVLVVALVVGFAGCASYTLLSLKDQQKIATSRAGASYYLRYSFFVGPFFSYDDRLYVSDRAFDERVLVESIGGDPILSAEPGAVLPFGTRVTIRSIEFPSSSVMSERKLKSPRHFTWVTLDRYGQHEKKPFVLVLTNEMRRPADFDKALGRVLVKDDPRPPFAKLDAKMLAAIDAKRVIKGMSADALIRSRGHPDKISRKIEGKTRLEIWQYAPGREVELRDDVVTATSGFPDLDLHPPAAARAATPSPSTEPPDAAPAATPSPSTEPPDAAPAATPSPDEPGASTGD